MTSSVKAKLSYVRGLRSRRKLADAQAALSALMAEHPGDPSVEAERIFLLVERRDPGARAEAERAIARHPRAALCHLALAEALLRAREVAPEAAEAAVRAAESARLHWPSVASHTMLARAQRACGRPGDALDAVRAGLRAEPGSPRLLVLEGDLLRELGRSDEAGRSEEAIPAGAFREGRKLAGRLARLPPEEAEAELRSLADLEPGRPEVHAALGKLLYGKRRYGEAAEAFGRALALDPASVYFRRMAGFSLSKQGEAARAASLLRALFLDDPFDERVRTTFVSACRRAGDAAGLRAALDEALARHPGTSMLHGIRKKHAPDPATREPGGAAPPLPLPRAP